MEHVFKDGFGNPRHHCYVCRRSDGSDGVEPVAYREYLDGEYPTCEKYHAQMGETIRKFQEGIMGWDEASGGVCCDPVKQAAALKAEIGEEEYNRLFRSHA